jgi:ketosteroid isomerase-like protein
MTTSEAPPNADSTVILAERAWLEAHRQLDVPMLERLMADEYTQVGPRGQLVAKSEVLASFRSGQRRWEYADSDQYQVHLYGSVAVVHGRWRAKGINSGNPFDYAARYVAVWVYRQDRWQIVSDQSTSISSSC